MLTEIIRIINKIHLDGGLSIDLNPSDYDAALVKRNRITEILRRGHRETRTGVLNNSLCSRVNPNRSNENAATHYFLPTATIDILPPLLSADGNMKYVLTIPVEIPYSTFHLMLNNLPTGYYGRAFVDKLKIDYPVVDSMNIELSARKSTGNRIMFASKDYIKNPVHKSMFMEVKYSLFENDYVVFLKHKKTYQYMLLTIPEALGDHMELNQYLDQLHNNNSNTPVSSTYFQVTGGQNLIVFGAPGTGKSNWIKEEYERSTESLRITFHPEYTYNEFVGSLRPVNDKVNGVSYKFVPGPFTKILEYAYSTPSKTYTLIIEELNRANTAAVFGDTFQILDRDIHGFSDYGIENEEILEYINENLQNIQLNEVKLPPNLNIIATMNSADQGVFQMDTAFKRRWNVRYVPIQFDVWHTITFFDYFGQIISVKDFIKTLNEFLSTNQNLQVNEDRLIGPYFLRKEEAEKWFEGYYKKILLYLWDDIARINRSDLFKSEFTQFSMMCNAFEEGEAIFTDALHNELLNHLVSKQHNNDNGEVDANNQKEDSDKDFSENEVQHTIERTEEERQADNNEEN